MEKVKLLLLSLITTLMILTGCNTNNVNTEEATNINEETINIVYDTDSIGKVFNKELLVPTGCTDGTYCVLISKSETEHEIYIPDNVEGFYILKAYYEQPVNGRSYIKRASEFTRAIQDLEGSIKVTGGNNLKSVELMFFKCKAQSIDLSELNTSNIKNTDSMFDECEAQITTTDSKILKEYNNRELQSE